MRKTLSAVLAALAVTGGSLAASAADARPHYYNGGYYNGGYYDGDRRYYKHRHNGDAALAAGIVGLALGAALASNGSSHRHYDRGYYYDRPRYYGGYDRPYPYGYGYGYGPPRYAYDYGPTRCSTRTYWDPYYDDYVRRTTCW